MSLLPIHHCKLEIPQSALYFSFSEYGFSIIGGSFFSNQTVSTDDQALRENDNSFQLEDFHIRIDFCKIRMLINITRKKEAEYSLCIIHTGTRFGFRYI